jgi:hypothetical protein
MSKGTQMVCTKASFRIIGKDLDPSEITNLLKIHPDQFHRCGDSNMSKVGRRYADFTEGLWALHSPADETQSIDAHLEALVAKLWKHRDDNLGFVLKNTLLTRVMQLGVDLDLDLYPS